MRVHYLQHVPFEGLGSMQSVFEQNRHEVTVTKLYENQTLPGLNQFDWLIVMGGPMGVHDQASYSWLDHEMAFIERAIASGKRVLGICLGAQMIARVLGAKVYKNSYKEIGWFDIIRSPDAQKTVLSQAIPERLMAFHWHGDTFDIPPGAVPLAQSRACLNQGFIFENRVAAFQFHLETTPSSAAALVENCRDELDGTKYVQSEDQILSNPKLFFQINKVMALVLSALEKG